LQAENPRHLSKYEDRLAKLQKVLARKEEGSNNWKKIKTEIAKLHEKIKNVLKDFLHKHKADWYNRVFHKVDRFFASTQKCSECGTKNPRLKDLSIREWTCGECGASIYI